jgi:hypothetical protein
MSVSPLWSSAVSKTIVVASGTQAAVNSSGNTENMFGKPTTFEFSVDAKLHAARICCYLVLAGCILELMQQAVSTKMPNSARSGASNFEKIFCDLLSALSCDVVNILPWGWLSYVRKHMEKDSMQANWLDSIIRST